ncbi:hypothetical protein ACFUN7_00125 [Streptomyces sp. NPDC057236]|uniref:hypothetical protein n=1 Tax=Streptomyces sp. NPDC057236 TaxID=3346059 RepID=UPI003640529D
MTASHGSPGATDQAGEHTSHADTFVIVGDGLAGTGVNPWDVIDPIRALIESGAGTDDSALRDPAVPPESPGA